MKRSTCGSIFSTAMGALALSVALIGAPSALAQPVSVTIDGTDYYAYELLVLPIPAGDVVEDPQDPGRLYMAQDDTLGAGGGIYRLEPLGPFWVRGEKIAAIDNPTSILFAPDGDLWFARDYEEGIGVIRSPRTGAPYTVEEIIEEFGMPTTPTEDRDDDPIAIALAPPGFDGSNVDPGEMVIGDRGADGNDPNDFYVYTLNATLDPPGSGFPLDPTQYKRYLANTFTLSEYNTINLNDFTFTSDGSALLAVFAGGQIAQLNAEGEDTPLVPTGVTFTSTSGIATNPIDGRIWVADDNLDEIWSFDMGTLAARREMLFTRAGSAAPNGINFREPEISFTGNGEYIWVSDISTPKYLWVFKKRQPGNNPPTARITTDVPNYTLPLDDFSFTLDGTTSDDGDGGSQGLTYQWVQLYGPAATIASPTAPSTTVTVSRPGAYGFALLVDDGQAVNNQAMTSVAIAPLVYFEASATCPYKKGFAVPIAEPGEVVFDPTDNNRMYVMNDAAVANGGGIWRLDKVDGGYALGEQIVSTANPSGLAFTPNGDLWHLTDYAGTVWRIPAPRLGAPYTNEMVISEFGGSGDDDSIQLVTAPPGFDGTNVDPGDLVIGDRGFDSNPPNAVFVYSPTLPVGDPGAYTTTLGSSPFLPSTYNDNDINDLAFSKDGSTLFIALDKGQILKLDAEGNLLGTVPVTGVSLTNLEAIGVNPLDGRIWASDDNIDQVWSIDPDTGEARLELSFFRPTDTRVDHQINFHDPGVSFSPDGRKIFISDVTDTVAEGWLWIIEKPTGADFDGDGDVDVNDFAHFQICFNGSSRPPAAEGCSDADFEPDGDVDVNDFAVFQLCFNGAARPPACE